MGQFTEQRGVYDEDGHPKRGNEVYRDTVHPQGGNPDVDFVGSSTLKRIYPNTDTKTNTPGPEDSRIPLGATVDAEGVIHL